MFRNKSILAFFIFLIAFLAAPALAQSNRSSTETERWREDLRYLAEQMPLKHKNLFHSMTRQQFEDAVSSLDARLPTMARHQIIVEMARIVALVRDGHTNISPNRDTKIGFRALPIKLYFFKDGFFIRAADRDHAHLVGGRVIEIGDASVANAYASVGELIGRDNEMDVKFFAPHLMVMPEVLASLGLIPDMGSVRLKIEKEGKIITAVLKSAGPAEMLPPDTDTTWVSNPNWVDARTGGSGPPLWLRDPQNKFWFEYLPASKTIYLQLNQVGNKQDETLQAFSKRVFDFADANPVDRFVLDLRLNRGGNGELIRPLLLGIIKAGKIDQPGKLFTIVGRGTWSAAQFLVNDLERLTNTLFVGEPTGGKVNSYGDSRKIILPNSGITVRVSTLWWQGDERDTREWTAPQIAADLTFDDYRNNVDPALQSVLNYAPQRSLRDILLDAKSTNDPAELSARFRLWRSNSVNAYIDPEAQLLDVGYELLNDKKISQAISVFRLNVEANSSSANAYDSLAEAYERDGKRELAIQNYEKALTLDAKMESSRDALIRLKGK